jgi:hypothetical protein
MHEHFEYSRFRRVHVILLDHLKRGGEREGRMTMRKKGRGHQ